MKIYGFGAGALLVLLTATACKSHYEVKSVERTRIVVDNRYDRQPDEAAAQFLAPYKRVVDSIMGPVIGVAAHSMAVQRPESDLSNLLADILMWAGPKLGEQPVFSVYNCGGIRAALTKGQITYGNVLDIAPFENKIAFTTLSGDLVMELFSQMAARGGEGVSHGVELVITKDNKLVSARLNGESIDPQKDYRVTTIDYLVQGNDGLTAFTKGKDLNSPQDSMYNSRFIIMDYFRAMQAEGKEIDSQVEGRIKVIEN